ncbi:unnamed protein product (macronuclear) [Paramecium tetraurelia]|uniref:Uncharacterized protein n=1 Tax=Paramecium tetraurelia TaxID=5888 RepID=A0DA09_PARTE|nr:uncharacterized protein GSPATT00014808001 [Paramecium tetraurelia]CAK79876.1 unnamed protein product [Paramecium tetraurelia]|eukprot:XP_001447273.1 hypothetical protein (macronuclear) [Paramecium tetraurelia strain d4-2]
MQQKFKSNLKNIITECEQLKDQNASFNLEISNFTTKYRMRFSNIIKRASTEENKKLQEEKSLKMNIKLHNYLCKQIIDSTQYNLQRPNRKAQKYKLQEETFFDRNPVLYLKQQLQQDKQRSLKLSIQARHFSIQQQKFVQKLENYKDFIGLK